MLVNFNIDPDAIDNSTNEYHVSELRKKWQLSGVLARPSFDDGSLSLISRKFLELNQEKRSLWDDAWQEIENNPTLYLRCRDNFRVALVSETRATNSQIPKGGSVYFRSASIGRVEWIRLKEAGASKEFEQAENLATTPISANQLVQRLWQDRFQSLAKTSQDIVIIDRYTAVESLNCVNGAHGIDCELFRLLDLIEQDSRNCRVTVYSSCDAGRTNRSSPSLEHLKVSLEAELRNRNFENINAVTINLPNNYHFSGSAARDRFIRFGAKVCELGHGIDIFKGNRVGIGTTFTMKSNTEAIRHVHTIEAYLREKTNLESNVIVAP